MKTAVVLVLDLGSSSLKAAFFNQKGERVAFLRMSYGSEKIPDFFHRSVETILETVKRAIKMLFLQVKDVEIESVVVGGNGPTWVALDDRGEVLGYPFPWLAHCDGAPQVTSRCLRLLYAFSQQQNHLFAAASTFIPLSDFIPYFLTGSLVASLSCEKSQSLYWDEEQCREVGISFQALPEFVLTGERVGVVQKEAGNWMGIPEGAKVIAGAPDYVLGLIGSGSMAVGRVFNRTGTSEAVNVVLSEESEKGAFFWDHLKTDSFFLPPTGALFSEWFFKYYSDSGKMAQITEDLACRNPLVGNDSAFRSGQLLLEKFEGYFVEAVESLRRRGYKIDEAVVGGSQGESLEWIRRKGRAAGVRLKVSRYPSCELTGGAVLALSEGRQNVVKVAERVLGSYRN